MKFITIEPATLPTGRSLNAIIFEWEEGKPRVAKDGGFYIDISKYPLELWEESWGVSKGTPYLMVSAVTLYGIIQEENWVENHRASLDTRTSS